MSEKQVFGLSDMKCNAYKEVFGKDAWASMTKFRVPELDELAIMIEQDSWSDYEVNVIKNYKGKVTYKQIAEFLNYKCHNGRRIRSSESVRSKWRRL